MMIRGLFWVLACIASAAGQCALHDAPALFASEPAPARLGLSLRGTALSAAPGSLSEAELSAGLAFGPHWDASLRWAFAVLSLPAGTAAGLGDPAGEIGYRLRMGNWTFGIAGRMSVPLGDAGNGLGADAYGAAGSLSAVLMRPGWSAGALAGYHAMFGARGMGRMHMDMGPDAPLSMAYALAHPHADRELAYRARWERDLGRWGFGLSLDGAHALRDAMGVPGTDFLEGETSLRFGSGSATWRPSVRFPLSPDRRLDLGLGLAADQAW